MAGPPSRACAPWPVSSLPRSRACCVWTSHLSWAWQVAHVDVPVDQVAALPGRWSRSPTSSLVRRLAGVLPPDVAVRSTEVVPEVFDARFSATGRHYRYRISDTSHRPDPLLRSHLVWVRDLLDTSAMQRAAVHLVGEQDFIAYCKPRTGATTVRTLRRLDVDRTSHGLVSVDLEADAFCHNQVRALVGALMSVGTGRRPESWPGEVLRAERRDGAVHVAPAHGLTLEQVDYPPEHDLAGQAARARTLRGRPW